MKADEELPLAEARAPRQAQRALLRARAKALARAPRDAAADRKVFQAVVFALGDERYALDTRHVLRVDVLSALTPLPGAGSPLHGLTQWRGDVLTLLDLRRALGANLRGITDLGRVIVVEGPDRRFGMLVERLLDIRELDRQRLKALPREDFDEGSLLRGVTDDAVLVIDDDALVTLYGTSNDENAARRGGLSQSEVDG
jgi:purine-binding chemotaxis protein CheW